MTNVLLLRILTQLEVGTNGTAVTPQSLTNPTFNPSPSDIRVNILWFLSLIFSLATVLVGIITLQWLREHLRVHNLEPQIALSLHHLNVDSFNQWYLPQIFTTLSVLLQVALVLFLVGIFEFLWNLNHTVAIPVAVAVGLSLFFLLLTTILPTMQALSLFLPRLRMSPKPRSPCPYRSPQSWAFHQLVRPVISTVLKITRPKSFWDDYGLTSHGMISEQDRRSYGETGSTRRRRPINLIFRRVSGDSWAELGIAWLFQRDLDHMERLRTFKESDLEFRLRPVPIYDTFEILVEVRANGSSQDTLLARYCDEPLVQANKTNMDYMRYLTYLVADASWKGRDWDDGPETVSLEVLEYHNMLFFHLLQGSRRLDGIKYHLFEIIASNTRAMFANGAKTLKDFWLARWCPYTYSDFDDCPGEHR